MTATNPSSQNSYDDRPNEDDPMEDFQLFDKVQLTKLLIHSLKELGYEDSAIKLQDESGGIQVESSIVQNLFRWVRTGKYQNIDFSVLAQLPLENGRLADDLNLSELLNIQSNFNGLEESKVSNNSMKIENVIMNPIDPAKTIERLNLNLEVFQGITKFIEGEKVNSNNVDQIKRILEISILICREVFLELIFENKDFSTALLLLRGTVRKYIELWEPLLSKMDFQDEEDTFVPENILREMSTLITCPNEIVGSETWPNSLTKSRENLVQSISSYINPNDLVPKGRLLTLLKQAIKYQRSKDVFNLSEGSTSNTIEINNSNDAKLGAKYSLLQDNSTNFQHINFESQTTLTQHSDEVWYLQFSPNGKYLASVSADASTDRKIFIYDVEKDFQVYKILSGNSQCVLYLSFSPDSKYLVSCPFNAIVNIYDIHMEGEPIEVNPDTENSITAEVINPLDSFFVLPAKEFKRLRSDPASSLDVGDDETTDPLSQPDRTSHTSAGIGTSSPTDSRSGSGSPSHHSINPVRVWCCDWFHTEAHKGKFAVGSPDREVAIYDLNVFTVVCCFSLNTIIPASVSHQISSLNTNISNGASPPSFTNGGRDSSFSSAEVFPRVHDLKISYDDKSLILMTHQGKIDIYDISKLPSELEGHHDYMSDYLKNIYPLVNRLNVEKNMTCISLPKMGSAYDSYLDSLLLVNLQSNEMQLWNYKENLLLQKYYGQKQEQFIIRSCFGYDNKLVASGSEDGKVYIWDRVRGNIVGVLKAHVNDKVPPASSNKKYGKNCNIVTWNPANENMFASGGDDGYVKIWKLVKE
ncbi:Glucose-induced degradation protein 7 [Nakaseomyces bracarensis]|uniref:Glucose-induced degradation protein 7 n=1 Tax=Nakaseomyces bracarensis TaxID=273131 RepID=A0ABR4NYY3_9SACH